MQNKQLTVDLTNLLNDLKIELGMKGLIACREELKLLADLIEARPPLSLFDRRDIQSNELVTCIQQIIKSIDEEVHHLEIEMHGVIHYSDYMHDKIMSFEYKKILRDHLAKLISFSVIKKPTLELV